MNEYYFPSTFTATYEVACFTSSGSRYRLVATSLHNLKMIIMVFRKLFRPYNSVTDNFFLNRKLLLTRKDVGLISTQAVDGVPLPHVHTILSPTHFFEAGPTFRHFSESL